MEPLSGCRPQFCRRRPVAESRASGKGRADRCLFQPFRRDDAWPDYRFGRGPGRASRSGHAPLRPYQFLGRTYPPAFERFEFLRWFNGILVSGEVGLIKPDPRIFELLIERFAIDPRRAVYIDDVETNVIAARPLGIHGIHFTTPAALRAELAELGLLPSRPS